jgi:D-tyrosyl-tRNA(Tyr) deacylase
MKALLQRVLEARVTVGGDCVGEIGPGLLVFLGLDRGDDEPCAERMIEKLLAYRVFSDAQGRMNRNVQEVGGGVLLVSQFTLSADTGKGLRPGFSSALPPAEAELLYQRVLAMLEQRHSPVAAGVFAADMQVSLVNDGPVTFLLQLGQP